MNRQVFNGQYFFLGICLFQLVFWWIIKEDPFFGDSIASTSKAALAIYDSQFTTLFYPADVDPGHPTLFPLMMAAAWFLFGKTLAVSHFLSCLIALLLSWSLRKVILLYGTISQANWTCFVTLFFATYLSSSAMMLNTTLFMSLALLSICSLLQQKRLTFMVLASLMMLTHLQASFFLLGMAITDLIISIQVNKQSLWVFIEQKWKIYTIPFLTFMSWLVIHHYYTGWFFHSPNYSDADQLNSVTQLGKSILLIIWRLIDYGMLPVHVLVVIALFRKKIPIPFAIVYITLLVVTVLLMAIFLENTIGHRYFLIFQLLAIGMVSLFLFQLKGSYFWSLTGLVIISLLAGNFLNYPGKNLGDATLAYRSYFSLEKQLRAKLPPNTPVFSYAPNANPSMTKYLTDEGLSIERLNSDSLVTYPIIVQSNINAEYSPAQKNYLYTNWNGQCIKEGYVYINVFYNPQYFPEITTKQFHQPSNFEKWMLQLKSNVK